MQSSSSIIVSRVLLDKKGAERITQMHKECSAFKTTILNYEKEAKSLAKATRSIFSVLLPLLSSPLPRVWINSAGSTRLAEPLNLASTHRGMGPTVGSPDFDSARMNDALERFLYQSHETIRDPLLKWVEAFDVASASIPELTKLGHESERQADKVRKAELSFRKRFYAASGGGAATDPPSSIIGSCMKFFSCKSRSKSMDDLRVTRPDLSVLVEGEAGDLTAVQRGAPIALELKEDEASLQLREEIRKLETTANAYDAMESNLNESFAGLCEDSAWLKSYMTSQLMLLKDLLQESLIFLGPSLPLSTALGPCSDPANSNLLTTGVTSKEDLIAGMPSFLNDLKLRSSIIEGSLGQRVNKNVSPLAKATSSKAGPLHRTSNITPRSSDLDD